MGILKKKEKFTNPHVGNLRRNPWDFVLWKAGYYNDKLVKKLPPKDFRYPRKPHRKDTNNSCIWINHSTFLIKTKSLTILTDPLWANYCSPFPIVGLKRKHSPSISIENLPKIDLILISHNHYDHLDSRCVKKIHKKNPKALWVVPLRLKKWFLRKGIQNVEELGWWETLSQKATITAVPAQHFSGRSFWDANQTHWNGYVVKIKNSQKTFYFVGDTGYNRVDFKEIGEKFKKIDLSMIPIGTYVPRKFMKAVHINPIEAVKIHQDVKSKFSVGMHWKTFHLSDEPMDLPPYELYKEMKKAELAPSSFIAPEPGEPIYW